MNIIVYFSYDREEEEIVVAEDEIHNLEDLIREKIEELENVEDIFLGENQFLKKRAKI